VKHLNIHILIVVIFAVTCLYAGYELGYVRGQIHEASAHLEELRLKNADHPSP
jgi:hypothetical protein